MKRIVARTGRLLAIYSLREVYLIKQLIIQIKADISFSQSMRHTWNCVAQSESFSVK